MFTHNFLCIYQWILLLNSGLVPGRMHRIFCLNVAGTFQLCWFCMKEVVAMIKKISDWMFLSLVPSTWSGATMFPCYSRREQ
jgi:hypothetical protein